MARRGAPRLRAGGRRGSGHAARDRRERAVVGRSTRGARRDRGRRGGELRARILVALPAIAFALAIIDAGGLIFALGLMAIGLVCVAELFRMFAHARPARLAGFLGVIGLILAARYGGPAQILIVLVASVLVTFVLAELGPGREAPVASIAVTMLAVWWIGLAFAHAVLLRDLPHGNGIVIDVLIGTFLGDTGAYLGGRGYGRRPLAPRLSPNKTVEGLVIGIVSAVIGVLVAKLYQDWLHLRDALLLGVAIALAAPLGDLFESAIKRDAGIKDSGRLFGAHGGALDRLDATMFTIVVGYYVWLAVH